MSTWDDIDDLTDIYINKVIYPDAEEAFEEGVESQNVIYEMPKSIFITQVQFNTR
jgi:hypothetical protein